MQIEILLSAPKTVPTMPSVELHTGSVFCFPLACTLEGSDCVLGFFVALKPLSHHCESQSCSTNDTELS